jgi:alpha-beta hydrolase superfamily lysophospholipase
MGGWLMLIAGLALGERLAGLIGIAAAPDFTDWGYPPDLKAQLERGETVWEDNPYGPEPTPTYPGFWQDGEKRRMLDGEIAIDVPVRLLHGQDDADVPPDVSIRLAQSLRSSDVQITLVKNGDHRLSRDGDIALLLGTIDTMVSGAHAGPPVL